MKLKNYQIKARDFIINNDIAILAVGMGLGKTAATLHAIAELKPSTLLITAPKMVAKTVWIQEAKKWGLDDVYNKMVLISGTPKKRLELLSDTSKPYKVIGRDILKDVEGYDFDMFVMDELTSFKNVESRRTEFAVSVNAKRRVGLTGTFLTRGAIDVFGQSDAIFGQYGNPLGECYYSWRYRFFQDVIPSKYKWEKWMPKKGVTLDFLIEPIKHTIFTLSSSDWLEIPEVEYIDITYDLSRSEMLNYNNMNTFLFSDLGAVYSEEQKLTKLSTLTCDFFYPKNRLKEAPRRGKSGTKVTMVTDLCAQAVAEGEQILLLYAFKEEAVWLGEKLKKHGIKFCSTKDPNFITKWDNGDIDVLITHPASAGHGLNLQHGGRIVIWSTFTSDYEMFAQSNARVIRQGQTKGAKIYRFIANKTKDKNTVENLKEKEKYFNEFINNTK